MRIIIADRDSTERVGIKWLINSYSMKFNEVCLVEDAREFINEFEKSEPDILILELEMFSTNSWEIILRKVENYQGVIIAITTEAIFERAWQAIQLQAVNLLVKPLLPEKLKESLEKSIKKLSNFKEKSIHLENKDENYRYYQSLMIETEVKFSNDYKGMMIIKPEYPDDLKELYKYINEYIFMETPVVLLFSDYIVCLFSVFEMDKLYIDSTRFISNSIKLLNGGVFISIDSINKVEDSLHACYMRCIQTLKMVFYKGYTQVMKASEFPSFEEFDPLLNSEEQRIWIKMLEGENLIPIKNWLYEKFTNFPNGYPEPELIRISLTSILAQIRRHMKSYRLEKNQALEEQYQNIFNIVLNSPVLFKVVQELLLFIDKILEQVKTQQKNTQNDFIELGLRFIDEHFSRTDLNLIVVADYVNKSPSYFSYVLSQRTSQTFQQYLTNVRINKAKHLLSTTSLSIQQISFSIGFSDPNYFSRVFKNQTGVSPSTWKNQIFI